MSDEQTSSANSTIVNQSSDLLVQLTKLQEDNARLRGTQASLDRAKTDLTAQVKELETKVTDLSAALSGKTSDLNAATTTIASLQEQVQNLKGFETVATNLQGEVAKMKVVASMAGKNPAIALLAETGALPNADSIEDFQASLQKIADGLGGLTKSAVSEKLSGAIPSVTPAQGNETFEQLYQKGMELIGQRKGEEGLKLIEQAYALQAK